MNLFDSGCKALVNPVNCVGVMGAGLAAQFKERFPVMYAVYRKDCSDRLLKPGKVHIVYDSGTYIINFPTKNHFKDGSKLEWIEEGLDDMVERIRASDISSVAIPALGCGLGGLKWGDVLPLIEAAAEKLPDVEFKIFPPR